MKRLFIVDDGCPEESAELVIAETAEQAKAICRRYGHLDWTENFDVIELCSYSWSVNKITQEELDKVGWGFVEDNKHNDKFRREVGFGCDGDDRCDTCGLASFDGEFPVCPECHQCVECGCDEDCEEAKDKAAEKEEENVSL